MELLPGLLATFDRQMVVHKDLNFLAMTLRELAELTLESNKLNHLEWFISGFNEDPRELYEVPEVNRWIRLANQKLPHLLFWLTPGSLWPSLLCLNPKMHHRKPDGVLRVEMDTDEAARQATQSHLAALDLLTKLGMSHPIRDRVAEQAKLNVNRLFERKKIGADYLVVHPKTGQATFYQRERQQKE